MPRRRVPEYVDELPLRRAEYLELIEEGRETLSDEELGVLFALFEQPDLARAASFLDKPESYIRDVLALLSSHDEPTERITKSGRPYRKRLAKTALHTILLEKSELSEEEKALINAAIDEPNQTLAARKIGITYKEFMRLFTGMRRRHDF